MLVWLRMPRKIVSFSDLLAKNQGYNTQRYPYTKKLTP